MQSLMSRMSSNESKYSCSLACTEEASPVCSAIWGECVADVQLGLLVRARGVSVGLCRS